MEQEEVDSMVVTVENAIKVVVNEDYGSSMIDKAIELGVLETVPYSGAFSSYHYGITRDSFHDFLYGLKFPERKINSIMENV